MGIGITESEKNDLFGAYSDNRTIVGKCTSDNIYT